MNSEIELCGPDAAAGMRRARESTASDPYRPLYHFSPPISSLHDPAGLCHWNGQYHLFYLWTQPKGNWGRGHAVSDDLVHWRDLPMLPFEFHGNTGQVWVDRDRVVMTYGAGEQAISIATSSDPDLTVWETLEPLEWPGGGPRDTCIWKEDGAYWLAVRRHRYDEGLEMVQGGRPGLVLMRSEDLAHWKDMGMLLEDPELADSGDDAACPNFLPLDTSQHILIHFSHKRGPMALLGRYDKEKREFAADRHTRFKYGPVVRGALHAPSAFIDAEDRCIALWNITECRMPWRDPEIMSLPRRFSTGTHPLNPLQIEPIRELESLRFDPVTVENRVIPANGEIILKGIKGKSMELVTEIDVQAAREVGLNVLRSPNAEEQTTITLYTCGFSRTEHMCDLSLDVSLASLSPEVRSRSPEIGPLYLKEGEPLRLRVFNDRSVIEVFANDRQCLTLRAYPLREDSCGVSVFARGSEAKLVSLTAYQMRSIWPKSDD